MLAQTLKGLDMTSTASADERSIPQDVALGSGTTDGDKAKPVVPYVAMWSEEVVEEPRLVEHPSGAGIAYADEILGDRDSRGVLWDRAAIAPGRGKPQFAKIHVHRQRRAMRKLLCQVCRQPADKDDRGVLWLLPDRTGRWAGWPEGMLVSEPPVCEPCLALATRVCPALRKEGHLVIRAGSCPIDGVEGFRYRAGPRRRPVPVERELVSFADPAIAWTLASKLVRELLDCAVMEVEAGV
ncbi:hypothetical protein Q5530_00265 [Saccharothrix sp. BKS2]|uniref:hypothetical protein n=1 Tax=Saccharothrix sp. BKS2 TaxID=3064400 RepID=UPI0039E9A025